MVSLQRSFFSSHECFFLSFSLFALYGHREDKVKEKVKALFYFVLSILGVLSLSLSVVIETKHKREFSAAKIFLTPFLAP